MKQTKRFLSVLLSLCLVLGMLPGVAFAANNYSQFTDVNTSDWYAEAVQYVSGQGLMSGTSATSFEPDASTTRGMIATILYRLEGSPAYLNSGYTDVPANEWYAPAVSWAKTYNVVSGYGDGKFGPNDAISREQLASILFRYSQLKKYDTAMYGDLTRYSDQGKISSYAKIPLSWAVGKGVITGIGDGTLDPQGGATRAQVAAILQRYMENVVAKGNPLTPGSNVGFAPLPAEPEETAPASYTVTFLMNDGTGKVYNEQVVKAGSKAVKPETPRLQDRTFYGWFLTSNATGRAFDFNSEINSDVTLYADWGGHNNWWWNPNTNPNPGGTSSIQPNTLSLIKDGKYYTGEYTIDLNAPGADNQKFILAYEGSGVSGETITVTCDNPAVSGPIQLTADGIEGGSNYFSYALTTNVQNSTTAIFTATIGDKNFSLKVRYVSGTALSTATIESMAKVDSEIDTLLDKLAGQPAANKGSALVTDLKTVDGINAATVKDNEDAQLVTFEYTDGVLGGVMYGEFDENQDGANVPERVEEPNSHENYTVPTLEDEVGNVPMMLADDVTTQAGTEKGKAIILNSFPAFETKASQIAFRTEFYETLKSEWDAAGLTTTLIDNNPTIDNYKALKGAGYNVICISTHGTTYNESPAICLYENRNDKNYENELSTHQIAKVTYADKHKSYVLLPAFFSSQYDADEFEDSFIFGQCCQSMGRGSGSNSANYNYSMANAFLSRGAKVYMGYHNSVFSVYGRELMKVYINSLIDGKTSQESYNAAVTAMGANHGDWFFNTYHQTVAQYNASMGEPYNANYDIAYPVHNGDGSATLVASGLQNGSFEQYNMATTFPNVWEGQGDVRTRAQLGTIKPQSGVRMAMVTTGLGSQSQVTIDGATEGSEVYQTFTLPANAKTISFKYNYVSEEPLEFLNSSFDDTFAVWVDDANGTKVIDKKVATINGIPASDWYKIDVDFEGGDHTTYETGWKDYSIDVSAYAGQTITLHFIVYDKGDSIYDSAALIDSVVVK